MTQRNGKNAPIQGTSADILKRALRLLSDELRETSAQIVNIIHDEIVVEVDSDEAEEIARKVERAMCAAGQEYLRTVPVKVASGTGYCAAAGSAAINKSSNPGAHRRPTCDMRHSSPLLNRDCG